MTSPRSEFLKTVTERGFLHQCSDLDGLDQLANQGIVTAYIGFDATADSLHVGSLLSIMLLRRLQRTGHRPIVLMGGGTTKVGDPSGKDDARKLLTAEQIDENIERIKQVFSRYLKFGDGPSDAIMVNNDDWLSSLSYIPFLRDYGRHFSVNRMLSMDSVKLRLEREQPLSFLEFNYMVLQAYDFVELSRRHDCVLQMGGSDQWGNIVTGVDLGRRVASKSLYALTTPLLTTASGAKMGKTADGAVWLNEDRLSAYDFWQYWRNTADGDVGRFLRLFTELPLDEISRLETLEGAEVNAAKIVLANEATKLCRGEAAAAEAGETARRTFEQGGTGDALPVAAVPAADLEAGIAIYALLAKAGLVASNSEGRRMVRGGGCRVNGVVVSDENKLIGADSVGDDGAIKLSAGRKRHALIQPS